MRTAYEWETKIDKNTIENAKSRIQKEIRRICETTLKGNFSNPEDRKYWENRLTKLNNELISIENNF